MSTKIRAIPLPDLLLWRANYLSALSDVKPVQPDNFSSIGLSPGNSKTGSTGKFYKSVFVWNLPAVVTCPEASPWCLQHCYNADARENIFPVIKWAQNWWMVINQPEYLKNTILEQLASAGKPSAVRVHSSGDFFSKEYVQFWIDIAATAKDTMFWAYTRSWARNELLSYLTNLKLVENVVLFASRDASMGDKHPGNNWRQAFVYTDPSLADLHRQEDKRAFICPEQTGKVPNCASCGFCMSHIDKDILFYFH